MCLRKVRQRRIEKAVMLAADSMAASFLASEREETGKLRPDTRVMRERKGDQDGRQRKSVFL